MNRFDQVYMKIKKHILKESVNNQYYIDLDLNLINEKYCKGGVDISFIENNNDYFQVNIIILDDDGTSIRLESPSDKKLKALLGTFIDFDKYDEVCSWIISDIENESK